MYLLMMIAALCGWASLGLSQTNDLAVQKEKIVEKISSVHELSKSQAESLKQLFANSPFVSQGNPSVTQHPVSIEQCEKQAQEQKIVFDNPEFTKICGAKYMAPLYDPAKTKPEKATACIDQFEFPNIPCEYPVVWARADEAAQICESVGKRMCDAHEWEGACAGALTEPDYNFTMAKGLNPNRAVEQMRRTHNGDQSKLKNWAYGNEYKKGICGANSTKASNCNGGDWQKCGSNTYPSGYFPECKSKLGVYDQHGNAAEHMNLPLDPSQMASTGSKELGYTEMKGSWFIFDKFYAHQDFCRWRAPYWHGSKVKDIKSHHNYHLGFRCCKTLEGPSKKK